MFGFGDLRRFKPRVPNEIPPELLPELVGKRGLSIGRIVADHPDKIIVRASKIWRERDADGNDVLCFAHRNAYVQTGLRNALLREFGLGGTAVGYIGFSSDTSAVTFNTVYLAGASAGTSSNSLIVAISPTATISALTTNTVQTVTAGATVTNASFSTLFAVNKLGLLTTSTDAGTGLVDVVGGTGGTAPYDRSFSVNLVSAGSFSYTAQLAVSAVADPTQ
jgi:hypothetical protein